MKAAGQIFASDEQAAYWRTRQESPDSDDNVLISSARLRNLLAKERDCRWWQSLLTAFPIAVVILDETGRITESNPAADALLNIRLTGKRWIQVIEQVFSPKADDLNEISLKDGRRVSIHTSSLQSGRGQLILLTDQTLTRQLQERVSEEQHLAAMGRMVASLAHQLRTPLSGALLYASHLSEGDVGEEKQRKFAQKIVTLLKSLENQISDMLIFAKSDKLVTTEVLLSQVITDIRETLAVMLIQEEAVLTIDNSAGEQLLNCNSEALVGAIQNCVHNALQACGQGAVLNLKIYTLGSQLFFVLKDNGPGIAEAEVAQVTQAFYTTKTHGTGLGLAVVKAVAQAHGGDVTIQSQVGRGSEIGLSVAMMTE